MANENRIDINISCGFNCSPLLEVISGRKPGQIDIVEKLPQNGANPNCVDVGGWSPVLSAVRCGDTFLLKKLLDFRAKTHFLTNQGISALHEAVGEGNPEVIQLLIAAGADIDAKDTLGQTPLMHAVGRSNTKHTRVLLEASADPCIRDALGYTPLDYGKKDPELWVLLASYSHEYERAPLQERRSLAKQLIGRHLSDLPDHVNLDDIACNTTLWTHLISLGKCFNRIRKAGDTQVCLEFYGDRTQSDQFVPDMKCEECRRIELDPGEFYISRDCFMTELCHDCFRKLQKCQNRVSCNKKHEFTSLGGEDYAGYPPSRSCQRGMTT